MKTLATPQPLVIQGHVVPLLKALAMWKQLVKGVESLSEYATPFKKCYFTYA